MNAHKKIVEQAARIAELDAQSAAWQAAAKELSESHTQVVAERNALQAQLDAARTDLARYVAGIDKQRAEGAEVLLRLTALVEEWERADSTYECAAHVRAILRGEGPMGWESREGGRVMMLWDDITIPWDRLTIIQEETVWAICAEAEWPDGNTSDEVLFNLTLAGVIDAIRKRGPHIGEVVWRTPEEWKEGE